MDRSTTPNERETERGAVIVEFAVLAPLLIMLTMGLFQVALLLYQQETLHAGSREGARVASLEHSTQADIGRAVRDTTSGAPFATQPSMTITPDVDQPCLNREGQSVRVALDTTSRFDIPFIAGRTIDLSAQATFRCE